MHRPRTCAIHMPTTSRCHPPGTCHPPCTCDHLTDVPIPLSTCCHLPSKSCCCALTTPTVPVHHPHANHACCPHPLSTCRRGHVPCRPTIQQVHQGEWVHGGVSGGAGARVSRCEGERAQG